MSKMSSKIPLEFLTDQVPFINYIYRKLFYAFLSIYLGNEEIVLQREIDDIILRIIYFLTNCSQKYVVEFRRIGMSTIQIII